MKLLGPVDFFTDQIKQFTPIARECLPNIKTMEVGTLLIAHLKTLQPKFLICENEDDIRELYARLLSKRAYGLEWFTAPATLFPASDEESDDEIEPTFAKMS